MFLEKIIAIIAPHDCLFCGREGAVVCNWCLPDCVAPLPERCYGCRTLSAGSRVCAACRHRSPLRNVWVRTQYNDSAKHLLYKLKFERASAAAGPLATLMSEALPYLESSVLVTSVPTASSRVRQRGYDHAKLLGEDLAATRGLSYGVLLARIGQTRQVGANRNQRKQQLSDAFRPISTRCKGRDVLLVDDVVTTGTTLEEAARCLRRAGARSVRAVVFAQKQ
jgi:competence protein ComFC